MSDNCDNPDNLNAEGVQKCITTKIDNIIKNTKTLQINYNDNVKELNEIQPIVKIPLKIKNYLDAVKLEQKTDEDYLPNVTDILSFLDELLVP